MTDLIIRKMGRAGYITLNRPQALNALTYDMCLEIEGTLDAWRNDNDVNLILIDGAGERAFCSGGDIADMYKSGQTGDLSYGRFCTCQRCRRLSKMPVRLRRLSG